MASGFDDKQLEQLREIVREERGTSWPRVFFWLGIVFLATVILLIYLASQTLMAEPA